jgi:surfeit locus 1 family protein
MSYARGGGTAFKRPIARIFLAALPVVTFGLGTWQVFRRERKLKMIELIEQRTRAPVVDLPSSRQFSDEEMAQLANKMEYRRVQLRGRFVNERELFVEPRQHNSESGFHLIVPFQREVAFPDECINV